MSKRIDRMRDLRTRIGPILAVLFMMSVLGMIPVVAAAQDTEDPARIRGRVIDAETGEPIPRAEINVIGTTRSGFANRAGEFELGGLRPDSYEIQVRASGYRLAKRTIDAIGGQTAQIDFELTVGVLPLDEIVVTGQPRAISRIETGSSIVTIGAADLSATPVNSLSQLLQARAPGVLVLPGGGKAGQGSRVLLRGASSVTQEIQPVIYLDGIRIDNTADSGLDFGGISWAGLDDININDIEKIEIVRGASAANLYGTEGSGGVIQIFTKQGDGDRHIFNVRSTVGITETPRSWWSVSPYGDWFYDSFIEPGLVQNHHISTQGSVDRFSYYISTGLQDEKGVIAQNEARLYSFRANGRVSPSQNLSLTIQSAMTVRELGFPYDGASPFGIGQNGLVRGAEGVTVTPDEIGTYEVRLNSTRYTMGVLLDYLATPNFRNRLLIGTDIVNAGNTDLMPFGSTLVDGGVKESYRPRFSTATLDYAGSYQYALSPTLRTNTTIGVQGYLRSHSYVSAVGYNFPMPGLTTINAAAETDGSGDRINTGSIGLYLEEQIDLDGRLFLNLGLRADAHSAFGREHRYHLFPKLSASYLLSDYEAIPEAVSTLRLRTAYGSSGRQPADYVKARTWKSVRAAGDFAGLTTDNIGNPDLGPETTHEIEAGIDAGLFDDRLTLEMTLYNQRTTGALLPIYYPPSSGFVEPQLENIGKIENRGLELAAQARLIENSGLDWTVRALTHLNRNRVLDIGIAEELHLGGTQWVRAGYPLGGLFNEGDGRYLGPAFPVRNIQLGNHLQIGERLSIDLLLDHRGGHYLESNTLRAIDEAGDPVSNPTEERGDYVYSADLWRLREVSIAYQLPSQLIRGVPITNASLSISGRNLWRKQEYPGLEAEAHYDSLDLLGNQTFFDTPLPRYIAAGISITF